MEPNSSKTLSLLSRKPPWFRILASVVCFIFTFQQLCQGADVSNLMFHEKNYVEKQGYSAIDFIQQLQLEREYLVRQQHVADLLNNAANRAEQDLAMNLFGISYEQLKTAYEAQVAVMRAQGVASRAGSGVSGFNYVKYSDGKTVWTKNGLAEKILNEVVKSKNGAVTIRNMYNMQYNAKRLLTGYEADVIDARGNVTHINWFGAKYTTDSVFYANEDTNANKHLTYYEEEIVDQTTGRITTRIFDNTVYRGKNLVSYTELIKDSLSPDKEVLRTRSGITYDGEHNMAGYREEITERITIGSSTFERHYNRIFSNAIYDGEGNLLSYKETIEDEYGITTTVFQGKYNEHDELIWSRKEKTNSDGHTFIIEFEGLEYDKYSQLMESVERIWDSSVEGKVLVRRFRAGVNGDYGYNSHGDLTSYQEEHTQQLLDGEGNVIEGEARSVIRKWYDATYTDKGQLASYKEEVNDNSSNQTLFKEWRILDVENGYNRLNQISDYEEIIRLGNLVITRTLHGALYDVLGQLSAFQEDTVITGTDELGTEIDYSKTTLRTDSEYSPEGHLRRYNEQTAETAWDAGGNVALSLRTDVIREDITLDGYAEIRSTQGSNLSHTTQTIRSDTKYDANRKIISYQDRIVESGSPDAYTIITRYDIAYNFFNRIIAYKETVFNSATPGSGNFATQRHVTNLSYDFLGQVLSKEEEISTVNGISDFTVYRTTSDILYNGLGQQISYQEVEKRTYQYQGQVQVVETTTDRSNMQYNLNGQLVSYQSTSQSNLDSLIRQTSWQAHFYNEHGQLTGYTDQTQVAGQDALGSDIDYTTFLDKSGLTYNSLGLLESYHELSYSSSAPDLEMVRDVNNMEYDSYGHLAGFQEERVEQHKTDSFLLKNVTTIIRSDAIYDSSGALTGYSEVVSSKGSGSGQDLDIVTTTTRRDITYDAYERLSSYLDTVVSSTEPDRIREVEWVAGVYDCDGRILEFTEVVHEIGPGLDVTMAVERLSTVYNGLNQTFEYSEKVTSSVTPDKVFIRDRTLITYNGLNQIYGFEETIEEQSFSDAFSIITEIARNQTTYSQFGLVTGYTQEVTSSSAPELVTTTQWSNGQYSTAGQLVSWQQRDQRISGSILHIDTTLLRDSVQYNNLGQITSYNETATTRFNGTSEDDEVSSKTVSNISYNQNDQMFSFTEETSNGYMSIVITREETEYNEFGLLSFYKDAIYQTNTDGLVNNSNVTWQASSFNSKAQVTSFSQSVTGSGQCGAETLTQEENLVRTNIVYDDFGFMQSYEEESESLQFGHSVKSWQAGSSQDSFGYDKFGRLSSFTEEGINSSGGPYSFVRSNIAYDTFWDVSRIISYQEEGNSSGNIYQKSWSVGTQNGLGLAYNSKGNLINFYETGFDSSRGSYTLERLSSTYNGFSQVTSFDEKFTNAKGKVITTSRYNIDYDEFGHQAFYEQYVDDPSGLTTETVWTAGSYNDKSQLVSYEQSDHIISIAEGIDQTVTTNWQADFNDSYTIDGLLRHYKTVSQIQDNNGQFSFQKTTEWQGLSFTDLGQIEAYQETTNTAGTIRPSLPPEYEDLTFEQKQAYQDSIQNLEINTTTTTVRDSITYDERGMLFSYHDLTSQEGIRTLTEIDWQAAGYTEEGLLTGYHQEITSSFTATQADVNNGLEDEDGNVVEVGKTYSKEVIIDRSDITYNDRLLADSYNEVEVRDNFTTTSSVFDIGYDSLGREVSFKKNVLTEGVGEDSTLQITTNIERTLTSYCDRYQSEYKETIISSTDSLVTDIYVFGISYDERGNQGISITDTHKHGLTKGERYFVGGSLVAGSDIEALLQVNPGKDISDLINEGLIEKSETDISLDESMISVRYDLVFDEFNQQIASKQASLDKQSNKLVFIQEEDITYNTSGQRTSYKITDRLTGEADTVVYSVGGEQLSFQKLEELLGLNPDKTFQDLIDEGVIVRNASTVTIDKETISWRNSITYNDLEQVTSYTEVIEQGQLNTKCIAEAIEYDDKGRQAASTTTYYRKKTSESDDAYSFFSKVQRSDQRYNDFSQIVSYKDVVQERSLSLDTLTHIDAIELEYNDNGKISAQLVTSYYEGDGIRTVYSYNGQELTPDILGQLTELYPDKTIRDLVKEGVVSRQEEELAEISTIPTTNFRVNLEYNSLGQVTGYTDIFTRNDEGSYTVSDVTDIVYTDSDEEAFSRKKSRSLSSDGSSSNSDTLSFRVFEGGAILTDAADFTFSTSSDPFGYNATSFNRGDYTIINNQARLTTSTSQTNYTTSTGSSGTVNQVMEYRYDNDGYLNDAWSYSDRNETDIYGNTSEGQTNDLYDIINGNAVVIASITQTTNQNVDTSFGSAKSFICYSYDKNGYLVDAVGSSESVSNDGFGNITQSSSNQEYIIINQKAKLSSSQTQSVSTNIDGSSSQSQMSASYSYDSLGRLIAASGSGTSSSDDGFGNVSSSVITHEYVVINNQAYIKNATTVTDAVDVDGTTTHSEISMVYDYDLNGVLLGAISNGTSGSNDGFGNITETAINQEFDNIIGQARLVQSISDSLTTNVDGSTVQSHNEVNYTYAANGLLESASGEGNSLSNDGFGNITESQTINSYTVILNQAKLTTSQTTSATTRIDGGRVASRTTVTYAYDDKGVLADASGGGITYSCEGDFSLSLSFNYLESIFTTLGSDALLLDEYYNISKSDLTQEYDIVANKAKLAKTTTATVSYNADSSSSSSTMITEYNYNLNGVLDAAGGSGTSISDDGFGNITNSSITQVYDIIAGQAKLAESVTISHAASCDGSFSDSETVINYEYNANGLLSGAWGNITSDSDDGFGNTTHATVDQAYTIIVGTAKLATSTSESTTTNLDLSQSTNTMITTYQYDSNGVLIGANGSGTLLGADGFGQHSQGTVTQTYEIIKGAAKLKTSTSSIEVTHDYDLSSSSTESTTTYEHDTQGKLISGFSDENTSGTDSIGNTYTSTAHRDYFVLYGQLKQKSAQTTKTSSAQDNSWTKTVIDEWYAGEGAGADPLTGYSEQGKVIRYHQVTTESGTGQLSELNGEAVTDWYAGSKDSQEDAYTQVGGWLKGYHQDTTITNYDSEGNVVFDLTTSTSRFNIQYYGQADIYPQGKMKSYEEISVSSDAPDKEKYQKVTDIRYDELTGRMLQQDFEAKEINLTEEESSADRVISITSGQKIEFTYNEYGLATSWKEISVNSNSSDKEVVTLVSREYDDLARVTYSENIVSETSISDDGTSLDKTYTIVKENINYNVLGQTISWQQTKKDSSDASDMIITSTVSATYDELGRMKTYDETGVREDRNDANRLYEEFSLSKTNINYDRLGQAISWQETSNDSGAPDKKIIAEVTVSYDSRGRTHAITKEVNETTLSEDRTILDKAYAVTTTFDKHNSLGQVVRSETITENSSGGIVERRDIVDVEYDNQGRRIQSSEEINETIDINALTQEVVTRTYTKTTTIDPLQYNSLSQVLRRTEIVVEGDKTTTKESLEDIQYDSFGRIVFSKDTMREEGTNSGGDLDKLSIVENQITSYNEFGNVAQSSTTIWVYRLGFGEYKEAFYGEIENLAFDVQARVVEQKSSTYSEADLLTGERSLLNYSITQNNAFTVGNKVSDKTISYYAFDDTLLDIEGISVLAFDSFANATKIQIDTCLAPAIGQTDGLIESDSRLIERQYDSLSRLIYESTELLNSGFDSRKKVTEILSFDSQSQAKDLYIKEYAFSNGSWQLVTFSERSYRYDIYGNVEEDQTFVYADEAKTAFVAASVTVNEYDNLAGRKLGNFTTSTTTTYSDEALSDVIREVSTENIVNINGFILSQTTIVLRKNDAGDLVLISKDEKINDPSSFNSNGFASKSQSTSYVLFEGEWIETRYVEEENNLIDQQGRTLYQINYHYTPLDSGQRELIKSVNTYRSSHSGITQIRSITNLPANEAEGIEAIELGMEDTKYLMLNAFGRPVVSVLTSYERQALGGNLLDTRTIISEYDLLGNNTLQDTYISIVNDDNQLKYAYNLRRTNSDFTTQGWTTNSSTQTYSYDVDGGVFQLVNTVDVENNEFNRFGKAQEQIVYTTLPGEQNQFTVKTVTQTSYDDTNGNLLERTTTKYGSDGTVVYKTQTTNQAHDEFGNPTQQLVTVYDDENSLDVRRSLERQVLSNSLGWEYAYTETVAYDRSSSGVITVKEFGLDCGAPRAPPVYNSRGQLVDSYETIHKNSSGSSDLDVTISTHQTDNLYNPLGQKIQSREITTSSATPDRSTDTLTSDMAYNGLNQIVSYLRQSHDSGLNLDLTVTTERFLTQYNIFDQVIYYEENVGSTAIGDDPLTEAIEGVTRYITRSDITYQDNGLLDLYLQTEHKTAAGLDVTVTTKRFDTEYNDYGQILYYIENTTSSATPDLITLHEFGVDQAGNFIDPVYDEKGLLTDYFERTTKLYTDGIQDINVIANTGANGEVVISSHRSTTEYNGLGQAVYYVEEISDSSAPALETIREFGVDDSQNLIAPVYNSQGQIVEFYERTTREYLGGVSDGTDIIIIESKHRTNTTYNTFGQQESCTDVIVSSDSPSLITTTTLANMTYAQNGLLAAYVRIDDKQGQVYEHQWNYDPAFDVASGLADVDGDGVIDSITTRTDNNGTIWIEVNIDKDNPIDKTIQWGTITLEAGESWVLNDIDGDGKLDFVKKGTSGNEFYISTGSSFVRLDNDIWHETKSSIRQETEYDTFGRITYSRDVASTLDNNGDVVGDIEIKEIGAKSTYDNGWGDVVKEAVVYDSAGRMKDFWMTSTLSSGTRTVLHRENTQYDSFGRITSYTETNWDKSGYSTSFVQDIMLYDENNLLISYHQAGTRDKQGALDKPFEVTRSQILYDNTGRMVFFREDGNKYFDSPNTNRDYYETLTISYDENNRIISQISSGRYEYIDAQAWVIRIGVMRPNRGDASYHEYWVEEWVRSLEDGDDVIASDAGPVGGGSQFAWYSRLVNVIAYAYHNNSDHHDGGWGGGYGTASGWSIENEYLHYQNGFKDLWVLYPSFSMPGYPNCAHGRSIFSTQNSEQEGHFIYTYGTQTGYVYTDGRLTETNAADATGIVTISQINEQGDVVSGTRSGVNYKGEEFNESFNYSYYDAGRVNEIATTGSAGDVSYENTTIYNLDDTWEVRTHSWKGRGSVEGFDRTTVTKYSATGQEADFSGQMEQWGQYDAYGGIVSYHSWGNISKDEHGDESVDWYRQDVDFTRTSEESFFESAFGQIALNIVIAALTWGIGSVISSVLVAETMGVFMTAFTTALSYAIAAAVVTTITQIAFTGQVDWGTVGRNAAIAFAASYLTILGGKMLNGMKTAVESGSKNIIFNITVKIDSALSSFTEFLGSFFKGVTKNFMRFVSNANEVLNTFALKIFEGIKQGVISFVSGEISKNTKVKFLSFFFSLIMNRANSYGNATIKRDAAEIGVDLEKALNEGKASFESSKALKDLNDLVSDLESNVLNDLFANALGFGLDELVPELFGSINDPFSSAILDGVKMGSSCEGNLKNIGNMVQSRIFGAVEYGIMTELGADEEWASYFSGGHILGGAVDAFFELIDNDQSMFSDIKLRGMSSDELYEQFALARTKEANTEAATARTGAFEQMQIKGKDTRFDIDIEDEFKKDSFSLNNIFEGIDLSLSNKDSNLIEIAGLSSYGKDGLQLESQIRVNSLGLDIQEVLINDAGLKLDDTIILVKDFANGDMYLKFNLDQDRLSSYMGDDFMDSLSGLLDTDHLNDAIVGGIEGRLYLDSQGNTIDRVVCMQVKTDYFTDTQIASIAKAGNVSVAGLELSQKGLGKLDMTINAGVAEFISGLEGKGLNAVAQTIQENITAQVIDLNNVEDLSLALNIEKVEGALKTTNIDKLQYLVSVDNLRDGTIKNMANILGAKEVTLSDKLNEQGRSAKAFIASMDIDAEMITDDTIKNIMETDKDMGRVLGSIQDNILPSVKDSSLLDVTIKNTLNNQGQLITSVVMSTPRDNILANSQLATSLGDPQMRLSGDTVSFAVTSLDPNKIVEVKDKIHKEDTKAQEGSGKERLMQQPGLPLPENLLRQEDFERGLDILPGPQYLPLLGLSHIVGADSFENNFFGGGRVDNSLWGDPRFQYAQLPVGGRAFNGTGQFINRLNISEEYDFDLLQTLQINNLKQGQDKAEGKQNLALTDSLKGAVNNVIKKSKSFIKGVADNWNNSDSAVEAYYKGALEEFFVHAGTRTEDYWLPTQRGAHKLATAYRAQASEALHILDEIDAQANNKTGIGKWVIKGTAKALKGCIVTSRIAVEVLADLGKLGAELPAIGRSLKAAWGAALGGEYNLAARNIGNAVGLGLREAARVTAIRGIMSGIKSARIVKARADIPIDEGGFPTGWHAGKHGIGEVSDEGIGEMIFRAPERYVVKGAKADVIYSAKGRLVGEELVNTKLFTRDAANFFNKFKNIKSSTVWEAQYVRDGVLQRPQVNVDFIFKGNNWRIAVDKESGQVLNFFKVFLDDAGNPISKMTFDNIKIINSGKAINPQYYQYKR